MNREGLIRVGGLTAGLLLCVVSSSSWGGAYKCTDAEGRVRFQQSPCPGAGGAPVSRKSAYPGWVVVHEATNPDFRQETLALERVDAVGPLKRLTTKSLAYYTGSSEPAVPFAKAEVLYLYYDCVAGTELSARPEEQARVEAAVLKGEAFSRADVPSAPDLLRYACGAKAAASAFPHACTFPSGRVIHGQKPCPSWASTRTSTDPRACSWKNKDASCRLLMAPSTEHPGWITLLDNVDSEDTREVQLLHQTVDAVGSMRRAAFGLYRSTPAGEGRLDPANAAYAYYDCSAKTLAARVGGADDAAQWEAAVLNGKAPTCCYPLLPIDYWQTKMGAPIQSRAQVVERVCSAVPRQCPATGACPGVAKSREVAQPVTVRPAGPGWVRVDDPSDPRHEMFLKLPVETVGSLKRATFQVVTKRTEATVDERRNYYYDCTRGLISPAISPHQLAEADEFAQGGDLEDLMLRPDEGYPQQSKQVVALVCGK